MKQKKAVKECFSSYLVCLDHAVLLVSHEILAKLVILNRSKGVLAVDSGSRLKVRYMLRNHFCFLLQLWLLRLGSHVFVGLKHSSVDKWCHFMPILNFALFFTYQLDLQRRGHHLKNPFLFSHPKSKHCVPDNKEILLCLWCRFFCFSENQWSSEIDI